MAKLGIRDVEASAAYASPEYMKRVRQTLPDLPIRSLSVDDGGNVVETAR